MALKEKAKAMPRGSCEMACDLTPSWCGDCSAVLRGGQRLAGIPRLGPRIPGPGSRIPERDSPLQRHDGQDPGADKKQLPEGSSLEAAAVEIWNQIGHGDVEEITGGEGEH